MRAVSSAGSEHLPYKQGVTGSNPVPPTKKDSRLAVFFLFLFGLGTNEVGISNLDSDEVQDVCGAGYSEV